MDKYRINGTVPSKIEDGIIANGSTDDVLITVISACEHDRNGINNRSEDEKNETAIYGTRHFILFLFCLYSMSNAFQWIEYSIISNIIAKYYDVNSQAVNWTSIVYMVVYIPLIFPASWLLDKKGLRFVVLLGSFGTCLGAWIKCTSVSPDRFAITMLGQTVVAISQIFILGIPPRLAAVWYSSREVSRACAVGVFGNQFGIALGFLLPPILVHNLDKESIGQDLSVLFFGVAGFTTLLFITIVIAFKDKPPKPPSRAQAAILSSEIKEDYWKSISNLMRNVNYDILLITYGINVGVFYAVSTLLNQVVLERFPGEEQKAGWMGVTIVLTGMLGSVICGLILDVTHRFKETTIVVYVLSLIGMAAYTLALQVDSMVLVFVLAALLGFFMTGYLPLGFEYAAEITYPESEGTSSGLLNASAQVFGIIFTNGASEILLHYKGLYSNLFLVAVLLIGTILTAFIKSDLRRQRATSVGINAAEVSHLIAKQKLEEDKRREVEQDEVA